MKTRFIWIGIIAIFLGTVCAHLISCKKDDMNSVVNYRGQVVYINTTTPFADLTVKVTDGKNTHCQTQTDAGGSFSLKVRVDEIDGNYYLLAGDSTCIPKKVALGSYGQSEVDLGVIEVEGPALPTVVTRPIESVSADEAILGGEVQTDGRLSVTARGVCYGTEQHPTIDGLHTKDGSGLGEFTSTLKNLEHNTIYYARAYATNKKGTAYGEQVKFTTELGVPVVITDSIYRITAHSARCKGHVESDGGYAVSKKGTCWSRQPDPTVDDDCSNDGSGKGEFTSTLSNLVENTTYYVRTYATNSTATVYGEQITFTTLDGLAVVIMDSVTSVTATSFTAYGTVVSDCDISVTARGFCYSTSQYPTIENAHSTAGKGLGRYQSNILNLQPNTTYYVRAYATNNTGVTYSEQTTIITKNGKPIVVTAEVSNIMALSASCGGSVTDDGGFMVSTYGLCWSTNTNPTLNDNSSDDGKGKSSFIHNITELTPNTTYYVRAYATNENGTTYGNEKKFTTTTGLPIISTSKTSATSVNITSGGAITSDGGYSVTARGICYSTKNSNPTVADHRTIDGNGIGDFETIITDVALNTTYYIRAYATNSIGTAYGSVVMIQTGNGLPTVRTTAIGEGGIWKLCVFKAGGEVMDDGGFPVTECGICWSKYPHPTISDSVKIVGTSIGYFSADIQIWELQNENSLYYIRAYATNENGTSYGEQVIVSHNHYIYYGRWPTVRYGGYIYKLHEDIGAMSWDNASTACENLVFLDYDDWFLPTVEELEHIMVNCQTGWISSDNVSAWVKNDRNVNSARYWASNFECVYLRANGSVNSSAPISPFLHRVRPVRKYLANQ